ncbi:hypothetical protein DYB25_006261 [Aphanomyces astaci]|uniref:Uncharacterized protein n=1 Tax=Aphanomyces astaci TaxID=112090 RepID=A0A397BYE3_APHAT|nr:hypothetical protein DYB36_004611 [Aphanomyces astaci]RHY36619.1 hypothetical protein DYB25_006261 [Aphanomyces astaci]RHY48712.1 hypothetical protein DYB34_001581 [Aphanomyces astaci]
MKPPPSLADQALSKLNCSKETLIDVIGRIPVQDGMLDAVHLAHERGWEVAIVSDANTVFIDAFLNLHNLTSIITQVFTNHSAFQGDTLHVTPYHPLDQPPHGCPRCPTNMCKGKTADMYFKYELLHKVQQTPVLATVVPWNTGFDILKGFQAHTA